MHAALATSPHLFMAYDDQVWSWDCAQTSLDGAPAPVVLPTGRHTFAANFDRCYVDLLVGTWLDGTASSAYTATDLDDLTAQVSVNSMRGKLLLSRSGLSDVTADGSGTWTRVRTGTPWTTSWAETTTYRPTLGSTLTNNRTASVATFEGGTYTSSWGPSPYAGTALHEELDALVIALGGTSYTLSGNIDSTFSNVRPPSYTGDIRITSHGTLLVRIHGDGSGALRAEVLGPLACF
jgi:hypothetical protein